MYGRYRVQIFSRCNIPPDVCIHCGSKHIPPDVCIHCGSKQNLVPKNIGTYPPRCRSLDYHKKGDVIRRKRLR